MGSNPILASDLLHPLLSLLDMDLVSHIVFRVRRTNEVQCTTTGVRMCVCVCVCVRACVRARARARVCMCVCVCVCVFIYSIPVDRACDALSVRFHFTDELV